METTFQPYWPKVILAKPTFGELRTPVRQMRGFGFLCASASLREETGFRV
jgi:hypothetical protein